MKQAEFDGIIFTDTLLDYNSQQYTGRIIHILCQEGNMGFTFQETRYNIAAGDYVILPNPALVEEFSESADFRGIRMNLSATFVTSIAIRSNYGIIGHLALLQNPVMQLSSRDFHVCREAMLYILQTLGGQGTPFPGRVARQPADGTYSRSLRHPCAGKRSDAGVGTCSLSATEIYRVII